MSSPCTRPFQEEEDSAPRSRTRGTRNVLGRLFLVDERSLEEDGETGIPGQTKKSDYLPVPRCQLKLIPLPQVRAHLSISSRSLTDPRRPPELLNSDAATASTEAMRQALLSLPDLLAAALTKAGTGAGTGAGAAANANPPIARTVTPRDLRDRKVPDFWEHNPKAWFVIFENHVNSASTALTEPQKFALLLPLLTSCLLYTSPSPRDS